MWKRVCAERKEFDVGNDLLGASGTYCSKWVEYGKGNDIDLILAFAFVLIAIGFLLPTSIMIWRDFLKSLKKKPPVNNDFYRDKK